MSEVGTTRVRPVESKTFVPAPDWVDFNFRSFSLRGKGLVCEPVETATIHAPLAAPSPVTFAVQARPRARTDPLNPNRPGWPFDRGEHKFPDVGILWHGLCK